MNLKIGRGALLAALALILISCDQASDQQAQTVQKTITMGLGPSTYVDQFERGIQPILEAKGYTIVTRIFSKNSTIPVALSRGEIDASVHISRANMEEMNRRLSADMIVWADTASAPQSLRSQRHDSLDAVRNGMSIAVPNDPVNQERALRILEELDWVSIDNDVTTSTFHLNSVHPKRYHLNLIEVEAAQMLRVLADVDFAIINGNYVANAKLKISDGLYIEDSPEEHRVRVSIRSINADKQWAKDLKAAYESPEFETYIRSDPLYDGYIFPKAWQ